MTCVKKSHPHGDMRKSNHLSVASRKRSTDTKSISLTIASPVSAPRWNQCSHIDTSESRKTEYKKLILLIKTIKIQDAFKMEQNDMKHHHES